MAQSATLFYILIGNAPLRRSKSGQSNISVKWLPYSRRHVTGSTKANHLEQFKELFDYGIEIVSLQGYHTSGFRPDSPDLNLTSGSVRIFRMSGFESDIRTSVRIFRMSGFESDVRGLGSGSSECPDLNLTSGSSECPDLNLTSGLVSGSSKCRIYANEFDEREI
ncbi:hypothetical protein AVEN_125879-1 [Araneus ventricosus]|uniref:Uncharacterized protein n=1 Tax=Araneus ventricosus TaxID=182803 RepID=A0A4Y2F3B2_ARAVE|nr:hypothetical protein AVEN_125879-1 [Araneus ventricosus]